MARYIMWDHGSSVITPTGRIFTPMEWEDRYPAARYFPYVMSGSEFNGALMQLYSTFKEAYERMGCDFTGLADGQAVLDKIEQFEDEQAAAAAEEAAERREAEEAAAAEAVELNERLVEALEDLVVLNMPDEEAIG